MIIKILQWNVFYKENPKKLVKTIEKIDPDIICGQEFIQDSRKHPSVDTAKYVADQIGYECFYQIGDTWTEHPAKESQGNAVLSRLPVLKKFSSHLQPARQNPPDPEHEGRVYVELVVAAGGEKITVGTTHLSYSHIFKITDHRKKEIDNLLQIIQKRKNNYVFAGDLNSLPDSYTIEKINQIDHIKSAGPDYTQKTWTTKPFDYGGFQETELNWRIDYVFTSSDLKVTKSEIIKTDASDHLPVLVQIDI